MPMNQPPMPTRMIDSAGRIEWRRTLHDELGGEACGTMFVAAPPLIGRIGQR